MSEGKWWTKSWNPVTGCKKISPGCRNCWAENFAKRFAGKNGYPKDKPFMVVPRPERLEELGKFRKLGERVAVCLMSDIFHGRIPGRFIYHIFREMASYHNVHQFFILTKRVERMAGAMPIIKAAIKRDGFPSGLPHVWLGVSIESAEYLSRLNSLRSIEHHKKFISFEPLLGTINPNILDLTGIKWVIVGGETGKKARQMTITAAQCLVTAAGRQGVPLYFKSWGDYYKNLPVGKQKSDLCELIDLVNPMPKSFPNFQGDKGGLF